MITSYNILASEHASYSPVTRDESKSKSKSKSKKQSLGSDSEDSDSSSIGRTIKAKPKKVKDALLRVKWWRIVLGLYYIRFWIFKVSNIIRR